MNRHPRWTLNIASPRNMRLVALVLLLITFNQIDEPLLDATLGEAFLYWAVRPLILAVSLWLADELVAKYLAGRLMTPAWLKPVILVTAIGLVPLAITEAVLEQHLPFKPEVLDDELWAFSPVLAYLGEFATLASIVLPLHLLLWLVIDLRLEPKDVQLADKPAPEFLKQSQVRDVENILAIQAEEHYVRIFSDAGAELIHYRFGDAVTEMPTNLGLQVHRSWWVAENAVQFARRGSRRWQLNLSADILVPVSDSYVAAVRARGWLRKKPRQQDNKTV